MQLSISSLPRSAIVCTALATAAAAPVAYAQQARAAAATQRITWATPRSAEELQSNLSSLLDRSVGSGRWGVLVVSLSRGDTLFGRNADMPLLPASTMKVFTSAIALDYLGPTHQFETQVLREGDLDETGALFGDLVLRGAGDPSLGVRSGEDPMRVLAREVADAGVTRVSGSIIGDGSAFEDRRVPDGWLQRYLGASYAARVSALSYNQNLVRVTVRPVKGSAQVVFTPALSGLPITNAVTLRAGQSGASIAVRQDAATGAFRVSGWIGTASPARGYSYVVENPEMFVAAAFRAALIAEGVKVTGGLGARPARADAERVAGLPSQSLADMVTHMNGVSDNHYAELLFRNTARVTGSTGSADTGNSLLRTFLADKVGTSAQEVFAADGSGLSTLDRVTPRSLVSVLDYSTRADWSQVFLSSLPIAGRTETLRSRMRGSPAQDKLRAKTGSTNEVTSLGGFVTTANGEQLAFAFIYNGNDRIRARAVIDAMGGTLAAFTR